MKKVILLVLTTSILFGCKSKHNGDCDAYGSKSVKTNTKNTTK